jgi:low temperature requirement protein LtrA
MDGEGVSSIELFFDLVFVFTITQLTSLLVAEPTWAGLARVVLLFGNIWWMYGGYAWLTNSVPPREPAIRLLMLVGMAGFLVVALAIPRAFGDSGVVFGIGYLVVTLVHTGLFLRSSEGSAVKAMARLGPFNGVTAVLVLAAGAANGWMRTALWVAAFVLHWVSPAITAVGGFRIRAAHFVERHGLIVLIALGESVVAIGVGVQDHALTVGFIVTALLGLSAGAAMWWLYFDGEEASAEHALDAASQQRNPWLALFAFGYTFVPVLGGVIVFSAGMKRAIVDYDHHATAATAWFLAGGLAAYVAGLVLFRLVLSSGPVTVRLVVAVCVLPAVVVGLEVSAAAEIAVLVVVLIAGIVVERFGAMRSVERPAG